jgi:3',5'-cyclic AMP phosphodiesterase CpdA
MRRLVHLSDLHFDRVDPDVIEALVEHVHAIAPDVIAVSGDLTQRARRYQFDQARAFLDRLRAPQVVVPGNHDVPLYDVLARAFRPLSKYRRHVSDNLRPVHADEELLVLGLDTTRSMSSSGGIHRDDLRHALDTIGSARPEAVKVVVCHHPFDVPAADAQSRRRRSADQTVDRLVDGGADVFLTGHLHVSATAHTTGRYSGHSRSSIVVEAGTATSTRTRGEGNAFNILTTGRERIVVARVEWQNQARCFRTVETQQFSKQPGGWFPESEAPDSMGTAEVDS